ncbi:MAG: 4-hydroxythreonine-4-phosphate dehydrogenase PdxA [Phycisphaerae bacterium]|nr:4-hydroxythreonine-4-phosphate dehydrogenase PdxA [Phycisphaerae bacterium]
MPGTNDHSRPLLAISMGDPAGVGAEVCVQALSRAEVYERSRPLVVGDAGSLEAAARAVKVGVSLNRIASPAEGRFEAGRIDVVDLGNVDRGVVEWGQVCAEAGQAAYEYVIRAAELVMAGQADALVTGPIHKEALNLAGHHYAGHTELLAGLTKTRSYAMMLAVGRLRVAHVTGHLSLREACERVRRDRVLEVVVLTDEAMRRIGLARPRIAVAALNPHGGEAGLFGREEIEEIGPAVREARARGIEAEGPLPADTMMAKVAGGGYDAAVAMHHDQGHIAIKLMGFAYDRRVGQWSTVRGVNVTLGLPIVRTSVDHGTAFDVAGRGVVNADSMVDAIDWATALSGGDVARIREG